MEVKEIMLGTKIYYVKLRDLQHPIDLEYISDNRQIEVASKMVNEIIVTNIAQGEKFIFVNEVRNYGNTKYELEIPIEHINQSRFVINESEYFLGYDDYKKVIREGVLAFINKQERLIVAEKEKIENRIVMIQKQYWEYLNY